MRAYIIKRLLLMLPTLFLVTMIVFLTVRLIPGSVVDLMITEMSRQAGTAAAGQITEDYIKQRLGLDVPIHVQYGRWLGGIFRGDFGVSLWRMTPIVDDLIVKYPVSMELGALALISALIIALPVGVLSAIRQDMPTDYIGRSAAVLAISLPSFWLATIVIIYPSIYLNWSPQLEYIPFARNPLGNLGQFLLPAVLMGATLTGTTMRMTRTMMLEVLRQDYIRTAWAKGLRERTVILRHAMRNAFIPVVTTIGLLLPILIGGSVIMEQIFSLPGIGRFMLEAITTRDYPAISAINLVLAVFIMVMNLFVDLTYAWLDPRVKYT